MCKLKKIKQFLRLEFFIRKKILLIWLIKVFNISYNFIVKFKCYNNFIKHPICKIKLWLNSMNEYIKEFSKVKPGYWAFINLYKPRFSL